MVQLLRYGITLGKSPNPMEGDDLYREAEVRLLLTTLKASS